MGKGARFRTRIPAAVVATALICVILVSFTGVRDSGTAEVRRMLEKRTAVMENVLSGRITSVSYTHLQTEDSCCDHSIHHADIRICTGCF